MDLLKAQLERNKQTVLIIGDRFTDEILCSEAIEAELSIWEQHKSKSKQSVGEETKLNKRRQKGGLVVYACASARPLFKVKIAQWFRNEWATAALLHSTHQWIVMLFNRFFILFEIIIFFWLPFASRHLQSKTEKCPSLHRQLCKPTVHVPFSKFICKISKEEKVQQKTAFWQQI